ncbi:hypothetical protein ACNKHW_21425 [Shigella flexneri]
MVKPVNHVPDFAAAGASIMPFIQKPPSMLTARSELIKENGCKAGLVFNQRRLSYLDYAGWISWM